jgi:cyclophilin family peptidyl-prolyl cis-trans isomerase
MNHHWSRWLSQMKSLLGQAARRRGRRRPSFWHRCRFELLETRLAPAVLTGGVSLAAGNVIGDGLTDVVTGAGPGFGPDVEVFNGADGALFNSFFAYDAGFRGGVSVAIGDVDGDGVPDIITGAGPGGGPNVRVFRATDGALLDSFMAYDPRFTGGVNVAVGDVFGDGHLDIITGAGPGGGPNVKVFRASDNTLLNSFMAYDPGFSGGVTVAAADLEGTGKTDIVTGPGPGGGPNVRVFRGDDGTLLNSFMAYNPHFQGGVNVAAGQGSEGPELVTGAGPGGGPHVQVFTGVAATLTNSFMAYSPSFHNGVNVADMGASGDGTTAVLAGAEEGPSPAVTIITGTSHQAISTFSPYGNPVQLPSGGFNISNDTTPPTVQITSPTSGMTTNQNITVKGVVTAGKSGVGIVQAQVDGGAFVSVPFDSSGNFSFTTSLALDGTADGPHTVGLQARSRAGILSSLATVTFTLHTKVTTPTFDLDPASENGPAGSHRTSFSTVTLTGTTDAGVNVTLTQTNAKTTADSTGKFSFTGVTLTTGANTFTVTATDSSGNTSQFTQVITLASTPTVSTPVQNVSVTAGASPTVINLSNNFADADVVGSIVHFDTNQGGIDVQLDDQKTPLTVNNFLSYVKSGAYTDTIFHRSVPNFVVQAGGFAFHTNPSRVDTIPANAPVLNEPGISNTAGTIAMAKLGNDPNSATNQFFFNLADNSSNLDNQNGGFTVFGQVTGNGMSVVNALAAIPTQDRSSVNGAFTNLPLNNYPQPPAGNFPTDTTAANYALINSVSITRYSDQLTFSVLNNSNPSLVTPTVAGNNLTLTYAAGQKGTATLTVQASNQEGLTVTTTFTVTVS